MLYKNWQFTKRAGKMKSCVGCRSVKTEGRLKIYRGWLWRWDTVPLCVPCWRKYRNGRYAGKKKEYR